MGRIKWIFFVIVVCAFCFATAHTAAYAEESGWKAEIAADKKEIMEEKQEMRENATEARSEEKQLRNEMVKAESSGDKTRAAQLREQLKSMHAENVQEMRRDKKELNAAKREFKHDAKDARKAMRMHPKKR